MKQKPRKESNPLHQIQLEINSQNRPELEQGLTFQTVDDLLSYDRSETEVPGQVARRLRASVPAHGLEAMRPKPGKPWQARAKK